MKRFRWSTEGNLMVAMASCSRTMRDAVESSRERAAMEAVLAEGALNCCGMQD